MNMNNFILTTCLLLYHPRFTS